MMGIGAQHTRDPDGIAWKQNRDFENLLKRLNANSEDPAEDGVDFSPIDGFQPAHVNELPGSTANAETETETRDEDGKVKKERKSKKKKRPRNDDETAVVEERKSKKRKQADGGPMEGGPSSSNSPPPTPESIPSVTTDRFRKEASSDPSVPASPANPTAMAVLIELGSSPPNVSPRLHREPSRKFLAYLPLLLHLCLVQALQLLRQHLLLKLTNMDT
jgi:Pin2-interacting protein X1